MTRFMTYAAVIVSLTFGLSACGEDEKAKQETPTKKVEETAKPAPKKSDKDMTPGEALDNMKRDAGIVADKANDAYNAVKDAATKALSE